MRFAITALVYVLLLAERFASASEPDLARARELFRQNRWPEAREAIASKMDSLSRVDRDYARFLLGLSHVREAELYRALSVLSTDVGLAYMNELAASKGITGTFEQVVRVAGQDVTVRGRVIDGVARIGTFFIP